MYLVIRYRPAGGAFITPAIFSFFSPYEHWRAASEVFHFDNFLFGTCALLSQPINGIALVLRNPGGIIGVHIGVYQP